VNNVRTKAVFDTGIILQAALSETGPSFASFRLMEEERIVVVLSPQVREEYADVLTRPAIRAKNPLLTAECAQQFLARMDAKAQTVTVIRPYL
jgi:predicted nucleic acid-binding protein